MLWMDKTVIQTDCQKMCFFLYNFLFRTPNPVNLNDCHIIRHHIIRLAMYLRFFQLERQSQEDDPGRL